MITLWLQSTLGAFMSHTVAPATIRGAARVVPAEHMSTVQEVVDWLLNPDTARAVMGKAARVVASEVKP